MKLGSTFPANAPHMGAPHVFVELAEGVLARGGSVRFQAAGRSMSPYVLAGDVLQVDPLRPAEPRVGDVVLYRDADGRAVAHRVVGPVVRWSSRRAPTGGTVFLVRGDAFRGPGERVPRDSILGRVVKVEREGRALPSLVGVARGRALARSWALRLVARARCALAPLSIVE